VALEFQAGSVGVGAARALAACIAAYAVATGWYGFKAHVRRLPDRGSAILASLVMAALALLMWQRGANLVPVPFSIWLLVVFLVGIAVTLTWTLARYQEKVDKFREFFGARMQALLEDVLPGERQAELRRLRERWRLGTEERRKAPHLMMGLIVAAQLGLGWLILRGLWDLTYGGAGSDAGVGIRNLDAVAHGPVLAGGHMFAVFCLLALVLLIFPNEMLRLKYPELSYPFKTTILRSLREKEKTLFGAHYYIVATLPLAVLWLARNPVDWPVTVPAAIAVVAVTVFADSASALVGIRFGRRKWFHNPDKSYMGSAGGMLVALAVALPFVGLPVAILTALVFLLVDVAAPVPVAISDNLLNPLALAGLYALALPWLQPLIPYY
jgi:dolichol kinase